jgi:hypothetical protein
MKHAPVAVQAQALEWNNKAARNLKGKRSRDSKAAGKPIPRPMRWNSPGDGDGAIRATEQDDYLERRGLYFKREAQHADRIVVFAYGGN